MNTPFNCALRTRRLDVRLRPVSVMTEISILEILPGMREQEISVLLKAAVHEYGTGHIAPRDPEHWTAAERWMALAWYLGGVSGDPDFAVGDGVLSDYLDGLTDGRMPQAAIQIGLDEDGVPLMARHLTGGMLERLEGLEAEFSPLGERAPQLYWEVGLLAATLYRQDETPSDPAEDSGGFEQWMRERIRHLLYGIPSDELYAGVARMYCAQEQMAHLFRYAPSSDGVVILPRKEAAGKSPARFSAGAAVSERTRALAGGPD